MIFNDGFKPGDVEDLRPAGIEISWVEQGSRKQLLELIPRADAYLCSLRIRVDQEIIDRALRLRLVSTNSTGTDHLDLDLLKRRGITVLSNKADRAMLDQITATAELAFGLLLTCARHLPLCFEATRQGKWERHRLAGQQLSGKTLGIIGLGRLGSIMSQYGRAFRMRVLAYDPYLASMPAGVEKVELVTLLRESDFVSVHVHPTGEGHKLLGAAELTQMKPGACLINTSRGSLIDEGALVREMKSGRIAAAGLDVIDGEWLEDKFSHPLIAYSRENVRLYISPHVGGTSPEATRISVRHTFQKIVNFFETESHGCPE